MSFELCLALWLLAVAWATGAVDHILSSAWTLLADAACRARVWRAADPLPPIQADQRQFFFDTIDWRWPSC